MFERNLTKHKLNPALAVEGIVILVLKGATRSGACSFAGVTIAAAGVLHRCPCRHRRRDRLSCRFHS
jgi:hypothetical protein